MTKSEISSLAFKILGVFCFVYSIAITRYLLAYLLFITTDNTAGEINSGLMIIFTIIPFLILVIFGIILIKWSDRISLKLWSESNTGKKVTTITRSEAQEIAFSIFGILLLIITIPGLVKVALIFFQNLFGYVTIAHTTSVIKDLIALLIQLAVGIYLFVGSRGIVKLWQNIQITRGLKS